MSLKTQGAVVGGVGVFAMIAMGAQSADLMKNYTAMQGTVMTVETDCFIEDSDSKLTEKGTDDLAYMNCDVAPMVAAGFDYSASAVQERVKVTYVYVSPVDGRKHEGTFTRSGRNESEDFAVGVRVPVFAHKTKAAESKTSSGNPFVDDADEI